MTDVDHSASEQPTRTVDDLRESAKGWHTLQFTLLGFIGLCGVLKGSGTPSGPPWLHVSAGILILLALIIAVCATSLICRAAWPLYSTGKRLSAASRANGDDELQRTSRSLRAGIGLTFAALGLAVLAATSLWWPAKEVKAAAPASGSGTTGAAAPVSGSGTTAAIFSETAYTNTLTWTDYAHADGTEGRMIPAADTVQVSCAVQGSPVNGDNWWYRIISAPGNSFYASAYDFYNKGQASGSSAGTPIVDHDVPNC